MSRTNEFFPSKKVEMIFFYISMFLFVGLFIGVYFISGVYFYPPIEVFLTRGIPLVIFLAFFYFAVISYKMFSHDPCSRDAFLTKLRKPFSSAKDFWPFYLFGLAFIRAIVFGALGSFLLYSNFKVISKIASYQSFEQVVKLNNVKINNFRRKNMLDVEFETPEDSELIHIVINRKKVDFRDYSRTQVSVKNISDQLVCIKGYRAVWGIVINEIAHPSSCALVGQDKAETVEK